MGVVATKVRMTMLIMIEMRIKILIISRVTMNNATPMHMFTPMIIKHGRGHDHDHDTGHADDFDETNSVSYCNIKESLYTSGDTTFRLL